MTCRVAFHTSSPPCSVTYLCYLLLLLSLRLLPLPPVASFLCSRHCLPFPFASLFLFFFFLSLSFFRFPLDLLMSHRIFFCFFSFGFVVISYGLLVFALFLRVSGPKFPRGIVLLLRTSSPTLLSPLRTLSSRGCMRDKFESKSFSSPFSPACNIIYSSLVFPSVFLRIVGRYRAKP